MHLLLVAIEQRQADFVDSWCSALVNLFIPMCTMSLQVSRSVQPLGHHSRTPRSRVFLVCGYYHLAPCQPQVSQILQQAPTSSSRLLLLRRLSISQKSQRQLNPNVQIPVWAREREPPHSFEPQALPWSKPEKMALILEYSNDWCWCSILNFSEHLATYHFIWFLPVERQKE